MPCYLAKLYSECYLCCIHDSNDIENLFQGEGKLEEIGWDVPITEASTRSNKRYHHREFKQVLSQRIGYWNQGKLNACTFVGTLFALLQYQIDMMMSFLLSCLVYLFSFFIFFILISSLFYLRFRTCWSENATKKFIR